MKSRVTLILLSLVLASCFDSDHAPTIVKGIVTNQITGDPVGGVKVRLWKCQGGFLSHTTYDSLKEVSTDQEGKFEITFLTERGYFYLAGPWLNSLTFQPPDFRVETMLDEGKQNLRDFKLIPLTTLEVHVLLNKGGRNYLSIGSRAGYCGTSWFGETYGDDFLDTARLNQAIDTTFYLKAVPLCYYLFNKSICNGSGDLQSYVLEDCIHYPHKSFYVDYVDTTKIELN